MSKIIKCSTAICVIIAMFLVTATQTLAVTEHSWYIRRNGNKRPFPPPDFSEIAEENAYYIDTKLTDESKTKRLYLTFDAGYENGNVAKVLDVLKADGVPAAFFLLDNIILKNSDLVKRMADEWHLVCNHTKRHKNLSSASVDEIASDLSALEKIYNDTIGYEMSKFFRFPEGRYSKEAVAAVNQLGYKTIFWSFGYDDWDNNRQPDREAAIRKILNNTHNGAIILLHPTSATNADILKDLIFEWRRMGYSFGTLEDLVSCTE